MSSYVIPPPSFVSQVKKLEKARNTGRGLLMITDEVEKKKKKKKGKYCEDSESDSDFNPESD